MNKADEVDALAERHEAILPDIAINLRREFHRDTAKALREYAAFLRAREAEVTDEMVNRAADAIQKISNPRTVGEVACVGFAEVALKAVLPLPSPRHPANQHPLENGGPSRTRT